jgi:putative ABC transport system permease protein
MNYSQIIKLALINVFSKKTRTMLTVGGIGISVAITLVMIGFGAGFQNIINDEIKKSDLSNVVTVSAKKIKNLKLDQATLSKLKSIGGVSKVELATNLSGKVTYHGGNVGLPVYGVTQDYFSVTPSNFIIGGPLKSEHVGNSVIINTALVRALGIESPKEAQGKKMLLDVSVSNDLASKQIENTKVYAGNEYTIVSIIEKGETPLVYTSYEDLTKMGVTSGSVAKILVNYPDKITPVREAVEQMGFQTTNVRDTVDQANRIFSVLKILLIIFSVVTLVVATFGTLNTITISLIEQTKEIGFLRLIGIREGDVKKLFIGESLILSLSGTVFGVFLAFTLSFVGNLVINSLAKSSNVQVSGLIQIPTTIVLLIIGGTALLGWAIGRGPAKRATKIDPLIALRQ